MFFVWGFFLQLTISFVRQRGVGEGLSSAFILKLKNELFICSLLPPEFVFIIFDVQSNVNQTVTEIPSPCRF